MRMNKKGFTLIELLMVVIIIGILVTLAIPNYFQSVERAKGAAAKSVLDNLRKAELQYRAVNDIFVDDGNNFPNLVAYDIPAILVSNNGDDGDWTYTCTAGAPATDAVLCTATRDANAPTAYQGATITMDQDGVMTPSLEVYR